MQRTIILRRAVLGFAILGVSACSEERTASLGDGEAIEVRDEPFRLLDLRGDGFSAQIVLDGEAIQVESATLGKTTRVTVAGKEVYADWVVDFEAGQGTGWIGDVAVEEADAAIWKALAARRTAEVLHAVSAGAAQLGSSSFDDGHDAAAPGPGIDPMLDGLRMLSGMDGFLRTRGIEDLAAGEPDAAPPPDALAGASRAEGAPEGLCTPEWSCGIRVTLGCADLASDVTPIGVTACTYQVTDGCHFLCPSDEYVEYWDGNCLRSFDTTWDQSQVVYCVGGGLLPGSTEFGAGGTKAGSESASACSADNDCPSGYFCSSYTNTCIWGGGGGCGNCR